MASRLQLQDALEQVLGSKNVYFQPPESKKLKYPCIVYERTRKRIDSANNRNYIITDAYTLILIEDGPYGRFVNPIIEAFPMIQHDRHYVADNLNHDIFTLFY